MPPRPPPAVKAPFVAGRLRPWNFNWLASQSVSMINNPYRRTDLSTRVEFRVPLDMNKYEIKEYLSKLYGFSIKKVNTMIVEGKRKKMGKPFFSQLPDWKKAIVFLQNPTANVAAPGGAPKANDS